MIVPIHIAEKILSLTQGNSIPSSSAKHSLIDDLILEGIIERKGRINKSLLLSNHDALITYLRNKCSINNLQQYIQIVKQENISRSELISVSSDSKLKAVRTFKGFLINCYNPIEAELNGSQITISPVDGTFQFIYDFEKFKLSKEVTIVGIENPENFRYIDKQKYLFTDIKPLFVSRYPQNQSKDLIKWLQNISNNYLHFGDFDFAGIGIYLNEFEKHLGEKAKFYIPPDIDELISKFGNRKRFDEQKEIFDIKKIREQDISQLYSVIHKYKKGLDQEILIINKS